MSEELIYLTHKQLGQLREAVYKLQKGICPILFTKFPIEQMVIDHKHRKKDEALGENGAGCIRGLINRQANVLEGKFINAFYRYGLHKFTDPVTFLRNLADYLEKGTTQTVHPLEASKERRWHEAKLKRSSYKVLLKKLKEIEYKGKTPEYPKTGRLTLQLAALYKKTNLTPEYYSKEK